MSVLIKGMEMPALCQECDLYIEGACYVKGYRDYRSIMDMSKPDDCPLIEVPTPHGRLIDADAFDERVRVAGGMSEEELTEDFKDGVQAVLYMLSKQPTIIEAEGSE